MQNIQKSVQEDCDTWHVHAMQQSIKTKSRLISIKMMANLHSQQFVSQLDHIAKESGVWLKVADKHDLKIKRQLQNSYV